MGTTSNSRRPKKLSKRMKPEIGYSDIVMASYVSDQLHDVEWNIKHTALKDPYFEQLSVEKFVLETLLREIAEHSGDTTPTAILEHFVQETDKCVTESQNPHTNLIFEISRDTAMSILDNLCCGYDETGQRTFQIFVLNRGGTQK